MNHEPYIIEIPETNSPRRFPVWSQLVIVACIIGGVLGAIALTDSSDEGAVSNRPQPLEFASTRTETDFADPLGPLGDITVSARAAYVYDVHGGQVLFSKAGEEALPLASLTKLMTALVAYELLAEDESVTVSRAAILQSGASGLRVDERLALGALSELALVTSSNDAAYAMGAAIGQALGDAAAPEQQFVTAMNLRAEELGLSTLEFLNPTGLDEGSTTAGGYGSAADVSQLVAYIITTYPDLLSVTQESFVRVYNEAGEYHNALNTNQQLDAIPNVLASKTGYTDLAGGNLTVAFDVGYNRPVVITVLGSTRDGRFADVERLAEAVSVHLAQAASQ